MCQAQSNMLYFRLYVYLRFTDKSGPHIQYFVCAHSRRFVVKQTITRRARWFRLTASHIRSMARQVYVLFDPIFWNRITIRPIHIHNEQVCLGISLFVFAVYFGQNWFYCWRICRRCHFPLDSPFNSSRPVVKFTYGEPSRPYDSVMIYRAFWHTCNVPVHCPCSVCIRWYNCTRWNQFNNFVFIFFRTFSLCMREK